MRRPAAAAALALALGAVAACSGDVTVPPETVLVAEMDGRLDPDSVSAGDSVHARLAGNLQGRDGGVLLEEGTPIHGTVTAVQRAEGRWPAILRLAFTQVEVAGERHPLSARVRSVEAESRPGSGDDDATVGRGLLGEPLSGRAAGPLLRSSMSGTSGTLVAMGTTARLAYLPDGGRLELVVTSPLEVPPPGD